jgi:hypothetical protein
MRYLIIFLFVFSSCASHRFVLDKNSNYISCDKVKCEIKSSGFEHSLNGYIFINKIDSSLCFKFFGPLGINVLNGFISPSIFRISDNINNRKISAISSIVDTSLIKIPNNCFYDLFIGSNNCLNNFVSKNQTYHFHQKGNKFLIYNLSNNLIYEIISEPYKIVEIRSYVHDFKLSFKFISISNNFKNCNFEF